RFSASRPPRAAGARALLGGEDELLAGHDQVGVAQRLLVDGEDAQPAALDLVRLGELEERVAGLDRDGLVTGLDVRQLVARCGGCGGCRRGCLARRLAARAGRL